MMPLGLLHAMGAIHRVILNAGTGGTVQVVDGSSPYNSTVGIRFLTNGDVEIFEGEGGSGSWVNHGTWISPTSEITGNEEVRYTGVSVIEGAGDFDTTAAAEDAWIGITSTRTWSRNETSSGDYQFDCDFEVRDTGAGLTTGVSAYTFTINNVI